MLQPLKGTLAVMSVLYLPLLMRIMILSTVVTCVIHIGTCWYHYKNKINTWNSVALTMTTIYINESYFKHCQITNVHIVQALHDTSPPLSYYKRITPFSLFACRGSPEQYLYNRFIILL